MRQLNYKDSNIIKILECSCGYITMLDIYYIQQNLDKSFICPGCKIQESFTLLFPKLKKIKMVDNK